MSIKVTPAPTSHDEARCGNDNRNLYWTLATNEDGWMCGVCGKRAGGEPPGYRPDLDRIPELTVAKVECVLMELVNAGLVYISNSSEGDHVAVNVARRCHEIGLFDQYTIIRLIAEEKASHADYWKKIGDGVVSGKDPRDRCHCGKLATAYRGNGRFCSEHGWEELRKDLRADDGKEDPDA